MITLIEFFDKDTIKNILAPISIMPDKIVFIYDNGLKDMNYFLSLKKCFFKYMPNVIVDICAVDISNIDDIYNKTTEIIKSNECCLIELTGGSELMMIAGYMAGINLNCKLLYTDIIKGEIININDKSDVIKVAKLTLEDFINSKGACLLKNSHTQPLECEFDSIINMCNYIFDNLHDWKTTCMFFQKAVSTSKSYDLELKSNLSLGSLNGKKIIANKNILNKFLELGFLDYFNIKNEVVALKFKNQRYKQYMINFGIWLELYVYINAKISGGFDDVILGSVIDWNVYDNLNVVGNEIDVIVMDNSVPVFISCKLKCADTHSLNELVIAKKRLGGWFSKNVIVAFSDDKKKNSGTYKRAVELGIDFLDIHDIKSKNFSKILLNTVKEQNLLKLKWTKI